MTATFWTIFGAYMFLPQKVAFVLPILPNIDKQNVAAYSALIGCFLIKKVKFRFPPTFSSKLLLVTGLLISSLTVLTNLDPVFTGVRVKPALSPKDLISMTFQMAFTLVPFALASILVKDIKDGINVLRLVAIAGVLYSPLMIIEVVLSPQLHTWIYGFFPHAFNQQIRFGGYRPVVFMGHGLLVANFSVVVLLAMTGLWKAKQKIFILPNIVFVLYGLFLLLICKSVGAWLLGTLGFLMLAVLPSRLSTLGAYIIASAVFFYPILAMFNYIPHDRLLELAAVFGPDKVGSLAFRFGNEEIMLAHGQEKILFGWGGWDRNRIDGVVTDGYWIIKFTQFGLLGYLVFLGLPMLAVKNGKAFLSKIRDPQHAQVCATFCVTIAMLMVDQIPNASQHNWVFFLYGAAIGMCANHKFRKSRRRESADREPIIGNSAVQLPAQ
ncbi:hypothetical protein [Microbulbifer sp. S227A]